MEQTLQALGGILLKAIPTVLLLIFLHFYLKLMLFRPLERTLEERRELTEGARQAAAKSLEAADRKTRELEAKLHQARTQVYKEQEETRRRWLEDQAAQIAEARARMEAAVKEARHALKEEAAAARRRLLDTASELADQIVARTLPRRAA
jgi:F-type H+-transporting ATPase subunit b